MACEVCEHCDAAVRPGEGTAYEGRSYHQKCYKCYVCGETNLRNAEIFKGVIFCKNCSIRIFEDLSTRKKNKPKRNRNDNRILELARNMTSSEDTLRGRSDRPRARSTRSIAVEKSRTPSTNKLPNLKKNSNEQGTTTLISGDLLDHMQPAERFDEFTRSKPSKKRKRYKEKKSRPACSDLRVAELGKSTEIAQMLLRQSEMPVIIKSDSPKTNLLVKRSNSLYMTEDSDTSWDSSTSSYDSYYTERYKTRWMDRRLGSLIKLPYISFKKNILERSSLVSVLMNVERKTCVFHRIKKLFNKEIEEHQRRGLKKLFSTINRRKTRNKLGWIEKKKIQDEGLQRSLETAPRSSEDSRRRCRHFSDSHSYRCMRGLVMRRAGPTTSQLKIIRQRIKDLILYDFRKGMLENGTNYIKEFVSQA